MIRSTFLLHGNIGHSGGTTNGTVFPSGNFLVKKEYLQMYIPLFSFCRNDQNIAEPFASSHCSICREILTFFSKQVESTQAVVLFHLAENSHRFFHTNGKRSRKQFDRAGITLWPWKVCEKSNYTITRPLYIVDSFLSLKPRPNDRNIQSNISQHCWAPYCHMLRHVGSNLKMVKFFTQHLWMLHDVVVVWPGLRNNVGSGHAH